MAFKANRSRMGMGEWMNNTRMDDPRYLFCWDCDKRIPHAPKPFCDKRDLINLPSIDANPERKVPTVNASTVADVVYDVRTGSLASKLIGETIAEMFRASEAKQDARPISQAQMNYLRDLFHLRKQNPAAMAFRVALLDIYRNGSLTVTMGTVAIPFVKSL